MQVNSTSDSDVNFKNYYNSNSRRFTFFRLELRRLDSWDIAILSLYLIAIITNFLLTANNPENRFYGLWSIAFTAWILTTTTTFGLRFRNLYFFVIWVILCAFFVLAGTTLSLLPLSSFILYQIIRTLFWKRYSKEFVPLQLVRAPIEFSKRAFQLTFIRVVSKVEGRGGNQEDKKYMKWLVRIGFVLFMACLFGIVGIRLK